MNQQTSYAQAEFAGQKKRTRREQFPARMAAVLPWAKLLTVIVPY